MPGMRVTIKGDVRLSRAFRSLGEAAVHAGLRTGVLAAARVIRDDAVARAPRRRGGRRHAADAIMAEIVRDEKGKGVVIGAVGPHHRRAFYLPFVELGHVLVLPPGKEPKSGSMQGYVPAQPFLRPAFDAQAQAAMTAFREAYWANLRRVAAALGALRD